MQWETWPRSSLFRKVRPLLQERIKNGIARRRDLASLALEHKGTKYEAEMRNGGLLLEIVEYIAIPEGGVDEFLPFIRLSKAWPEIVPPKLHASFKEAFRDLIDGFEAPDDPQEIRDDAELIERIGAAVSVNVKGIVRGLEYEAEKLEDWEEEVEEGDGIDAGDEYEDWCSDNDIHSIFRTFGKL